MSFPFAEGATSSIGFPIIGGLASPFDRATRYMANYNTPVAPMNEFLIVTLYVRGIITESHFYDMMRMLGYDAIAAQRFLEATKQLATKSDEVRYVVKEAYTPEKVKDLLLDEGLQPPEEFVKAMTRLGYSESTARKDWIAHYDPLGRGEFEELFQRLNADQIKFKEKDLAALGIEAKEVQTDLDFLLRMYRVKDIFPGLRKRMALIAYKPISRVDIRRLEDFGLLSKEELEFRNREQGYSPADAEFLARYTLIANAMTDIKALLGQAAISEEEATRMLIEAGAAPEDAKRLILRTMPSIRKSRAAQNRDLNLAQLEDAYDFKLITREKYFATLTIFGFDAEEAELIIKSAEIKSDIANKKRLSAEKNLSPAQILKSFEQDIKTEKQTIAALISVGYDEKEAKELIEQTINKINAKKR